MDEQIKPVGYLFMDAAVFRRSVPAGQDSRLWRAVYSQQSIDALRAEVDAAVQRGSEHFIRSREWATRFGEQEARAERAEAEIEALRWVVEQYVTLQTDGGGRWRVEFGYTSPVTYGPWADSRMAAIDAARKGAE